MQTLLNMAQYHIPNDSLTPQQRQHVIKTLGLAETEALKSSLSPSSRKNSSKSEHHNNGAGDACEVPLCYDPRIYTVELTQRERLKQHQMVSYTHRADVSTLEMEKLLIAKYQKPYRKNGRFDLNISRSRVVCRKLGLTFTRN